MLMFFISLVMIEQLPTEKSDPTEKPSDGEFTITIVMNVVSHTCQTLLSVVSEISKSSET